MLLCTVLFRFVLFCYGLLTLFCLKPFYAVLLCSVPFCSALFCYGLLTLFCLNPFYAVLLCSGPFCSVLFCYGLVTLSCADPEGGGGDRGSGPSLEFENFTLKRVISGFFWGWTPLVCDQKLTFSFDTLS